MSTASLSLSAVAPAFVEIAHRIVWCTVATVDSAGRPRTRILHPIWTWDGADLTGWIASSPLSPKARHIEGNHNVSATYWDATHDTCTVDASVEWCNDLETRRETWDRFAGAEEPLGYDPSIIAPWTSPDVESFGVLKLTPQRLRVMPGSLLMTGQGELLTWSA